MGAATGPTEVVKLAASDLTFLWQECRCCFWLKVKGVLKRPSGPFPTIFSRLDQQAKDYLLDKPTHEIAEGLYPGRISHGERWVRSAPLFLPGHPTPVAFTGRFDVAVTFEDDSYGLLDLKTSEPKQEHTAFYLAQLHSYMLAVERPAPGSLALAPITQLGLLVIEPVGMVGLDDGVAYKTTPTFLEIERDDGSFLALVSEVLYVLERPEPPEPSATCAFCAYLANGALVSLTRLFHGRQSDGA